MGLPKLIAARSLPVEPSSAIAFAGGVDPVAAQPASNIAAAAQKARRVRLIGRSR